MSPVNTCNRRNLFGALLVSLLISGLASLDANASDWRSIKTEHFQIVTDIVEDWARPAAVHLEEFRSVLQHVLPEQYSKNKTPIKILIFDYREDYLVYQSPHNGQVDPTVAGFYRAGDDLDYIVLAATPTLEETESILCHEYVHSLIQSTKAGLPVWVDEGLAEYLANYEFDPRSSTLKLGGGLSRRIQHLQRDPLLSIQTLFQITRESAEYNDASTRGDFYAGAWAMVNFLANPRNHCGISKVSDLIPLTAQNDSQKLVAACGRDIESFESDYAKYVRTARFKPRTVSQFSLGVRTRLEISNISKEEATVICADLLLREQRYDVAISQLQDAVAAKSRLASAWQMLGLANVRAGNFERARVAFETALLIAPTSAGSHYGVAVCMLQVPSENESSIAGYNEKTRQIVGELARAIGLQPDFRDAVRLLAQVEIDRDQDLDKTMASVRQLESVDPNSPDLPLLRAHLEYRQDHFAKAKALLEPITNNSTGDPQLRANSLDLLSKVNQQLADIEKLRTAAAVVPTPRQTVQPCDMPEPGPQQKFLRFTGRQICGHLTIVDCNDSGVTVSINTLGRVYKFHGDALNLIRFVSYTTDVKGYIECGNRATAQPVLATFGPGRSAGIDGELTAIEFIPPSWLHDSNPARFIPPY